MPSSTNTRKLTRIGKQEDAGDSIREVIGDDGDDALVAGQRAASSIDVNYARPLANNLATEQRANSVMADHAD